MTPPAHALWKAEFPRSNGYDPAWVLAHQMGPNALWLLEWLCEALPLEPGMRVLDLGCGKGLTSIFLAREMGVHVWATDLWVGADPNWQRIREAGAADRVCPIHAEAHALPFAEGFFDAVVSIDAYHYFGTDDLYLGYLARFVRTGGILGVVVPGLMQPIEGEIPPHLLTPQSNGKRFWEEECACFHTASWWRALWSQTSRVSVRLADTLPDGWRHWRDFERALEEAGTNPFPSDAEALDADQGRYLGFVRLVAERTEAAGLNLYDPDLLRQVLPPGGENRA
jgi:SAM-dependent methyltransferase